MKRNVFLYISIVIVCLVATVSTAEDSASGALGTDRMIRELEEYYAAFDQPILLILEYSRTTVSPPLPHDEAVELAEKRILGAEMYSQYFQGERLKEEITRIKQSAPHQDLVAALEKGTSLQKREILTFSRPVFKRTIFYEDGNLVCKSIQDGTKVTGYNNDPNLPLDQRFRKKLGSPPGELKQGMFLFEWRLILRGRNKARYTYEYDGNAMHRLHMQKTDRSQTVLEARFEGPFLVPVEYSLIQEKIGQTTTIHYSDYIAVGGLPIPSLVLRQQRPRANARGLTAIIGPLDIFYVLQNR